MKAERRHDLKTNTLDKVLTGAPDTARKYGGMALLVLLAAVAAFALIRYRISSAREAEQAAVENLTTARNNIAQLGQIDMFPVPPQQKAEYRKRLSDDARTAIEQVSNTASEPRLLAEAAVARGDLSWALANLDELPGAATQASLRLDGNRQKYLGDAEGAYTEVWTAYGDQTAAVVAAKFGLGAVYENQGAWDKAKLEYQWVIDHPDVAEAYKGQARIRLERAAEWSQPVILAAAATQPTPLAPPTSAPTPPSTQTATVPASTQPATTAPAVR